MNADIIFLSYLEENAEENWQSLKKKFPLAKRVHGITGIREAHRKAAELSDNDYLFIIDGDNRIIKETRFNLPNAIDEDSVYVWRAQNAVNGLIYGYGAIKLWPKKVFEKRLTHYEDHAMSATTHYYIVNTVLSITEFNTSEISSFRAGFRESIKLYKNVIERNEAASRDRLKHWLTVGTHAPFGEFCLLGARAGVDYYSRYPKKALSEINDFAAIEKTYQKVMSSIEKLRAANVDDFAGSDWNSLNNFLKTPFRLRQLDISIEVFDVETSLAKFKENVAGFNKRYPQR